MSESFRFADKAVPSFRCDLQWLRYPDQRDWILSDPLTGNYFLVTEQERWVASQLNGRNTFSQLLVKLRDQFPLKRHLDAWLALLINRWSNSGLLIACIPPFGIATGSQRRSFISRWLSVGVRLLSIRIPLMHPSGRTERSMPWRLLFSPRLLILWGLIAVAVLFQVILTLMGQPSMSLTRVEQLLHNDLWIYLLIALVIVKSVHEFGHYAASRSWGVGCREIGLLLLCFTPCLYCDVTDSWRLSSRWKRIAISAAGVYFELLLATAAGILWLLLPVGFARTLASSIMVTCTISTLMINFNPFFRYDGYYILSDLWGVPNLMQQAGRALWAYTAWVLGGAKPVVGNFQVAPGPLALFALLGGLYRLVFLVSLLWMLWFLLVPIGLAPLAVVIIASSVSLSALSAWKLGEKLFQQMHGSMPLKMGRIAFVGTVLTAGLGILLCYPFRISFQTRGWSSYTDTQPLYASQEASIDRVLQEEGSIAAESEIAALSAFEETRELQAAEQQVAEMETKIEMLRIATVDDSQASYAAPLAEAVLTEYRQRLAILRDEAAGRHLRSPRSGWLIPTSDRPAIGLASPQLRAVGDSLLNLKNQGAFIPRGAILGWVASSRKLTFQTLVPEKDLGQIAIGDVAYARLDASPFQSLPAKVIRITTAPIEKMPSSLTKDPFVAATYDAQGNLLMEMPHYLVTLQTEREWSEATPGNRCFVRFQTAPESFFSRAIRMISRWTVFR